MRRKAESQIDCTFGVLFSNDKRRSAKAPQLVGELVIDETFLNALVQRFEDGDEESIKVNLGAWKKKASTSDKVYLTVKAQIPPRISPFENDDDENFHLSGQRLLEDL
jgi:hypothetical protein